MGLRIMGARGEPHPYNLKSQAMWIKDPIPVVFVSSVRVGNGILQLFGFLEKGSEFCCTVNMVLSLP